MALCRHLPYHNQPHVHNRINVTGINRNRLKFVSRQGESSSDMIRLRRGRIDADIEWLSSICHLPGALNLIHVCVSLFFPLCHPLMRLLMINTCLTVRPGLRSVSFTLSLIPSLMKSLHRWISDQYVLFFSFNSSMSSDLRFSWLNSLSNVWECALMEMVWNKRWCFVADSCAVVWHGVHSVDGGPGEALYSQWYEMDAVVLDEGTAGGLNSEAVWAFARPKFNAGVLQNEYECWVSINVF